MGAQRFHVFASDGEQFYTRADVYLLRVKRFGPERRKVFMVEKILDYAPVGPYTNNATDPRIYTPVITRHFKRRSNSLLRCSWAFMALSPDASFPYGCNICW